MSSSTSDSGYGLGPEGYCILLSWIIRYPSTPQYLIDWAGFNLENYSWEPVSEVHVPAKVWAFHAHQPGKLGALAGEKGRAGDGVVSRCQGNSYLLKGDSVL